MRPLRNGKKDFWKVSSMNSISRRDFGWMTLGALSGLAVGWVAKLSAKKAPASVLDRYTPPNENLVPGVARPSWP
jgi:hypothetical protein